MGLSRFFVLLLITHNSHSDDLSQQNGIKKQNQPKSSVIENAENGIFADPVIHCGIDSVLLDIRTQRPFSGRVFVKGFSRQSECKLIGNGTMTAVQFGVQFERCGLRRSRELSGGISVASVVVVSFHPLFITKLDRAFRLNCFYAGNHRTVAQQLEVGQLSTSASIRGEPKMPNCRYDILWMNANGQPIRFVKIGDTVYHRWSCRPQMPTYCMRVHSCTVSDGQGGEVVQVLDKRGCALDGLLIRDLDYMDDLSAGQSASVFKFADKPTLHFNCQIELTQRDTAKDCSMNRPKCAVEEKLAKGRNNSAENGEQGTELDKSWGEEENYGANRSPNEQQPFTTRWNFASGLFVPGIVTDKSLQAAQFRLVPNKSREWESETTTLSQIKAKPNRQSEGSINQLPSGLTVNKDREFDVHEPSQRAETVYDDEVDQGQLTSKREALRARRELGYRRVADFDLPERSLVVIDVDEHSLAPPQHQHPFPWLPLNNSSSTFADTTCEERCTVSSEHRQALSWDSLLITLFVLLSLLIILLWTNLLSRSWREKMKDKENGDDGSVGKGSKRGKSESGRSGAGNAMRF